MEYKVSSYIESLPETESAIAAELRSLICTAIPQVQEKFSFKIPFYHYHGMFCYINYLRKTGGIELCFCRGKDLLLAYPQLQQNGRNMVAGISLFDMKDMHRLSVAEVLYAAADWQVEAKLQQRSFVRRKKS
ncbi:DUF1801 domain-containing protein [Phnomibacter sp. MR]|uniref:DUF1801 domain-containing protein n=1 Tax=Phnomibacter sp. MR TaxID=3042318 RepID=UPI003A7FE143